MGLGGFHIAAFFIALALLAAILAYHSPESIPDFELVSNLLPPFFALIALVSFILTLKAYGAFATEVSRAWKYLTIGLALWLIGECIFNYIALTTNAAPDVSAADFFWLIAYIPLTYGLYILFKALCSGSICNPYVNLFIGCAGTIFTVVFLYPSFSAEPNPLLAFLNIAYPIADFVALSFSVPLVIFLYKKPRAFVWIAISLGFTLTALADITYSILTFHSMYYVGHPVDILWFLGYSALSLGALYHLAKMD